jgi:archaemetzincin
MIKIAIIPIGEADQTTLDSIARALRDIYGSETVIGNAVPVPEKTYNRRRRQYHSTQILKALETLKPGGCDIVLGVIDRDLYVPELNFVFGEADVLARIAVIGLPRLRQEFYGLEPDPGLFLLRAVKEAIHETGHTCGLGHCPDPRCIMHFSNSLGDTDAKEPGFCLACRNKCGL